MLDPSRRSTCPSYSAVMALRLLWLRDRQPAIWTEIDKLMDHRCGDSLQPRYIQQLPRRTAGQSPNEMEAATVAFIRSHCGLLQFSEQLILHILGVIDTNAYIIGENQTKTVDIQASHVLSLLCIMRCKDDKMFLQYVLQGLFPVMSIINHSCLANTVCYARDDDSFVCRAVRDIKQGEGEEMYIVQPT